mgnify:CR=1 FL=1
MHRLSCIAIILRHGFLVWLSFVAIQVDGYAQNRYSSHALENMAEAMQISNILDTLSNGIYQKDYLWSNNSLTIVVQDSEVGHIGYSLFPIEVQEQEISPACRFVEQYTLWVDLPVKRQFSIAQDMEIKDIHFECGNFDMVKSLVRDTCISVHVSLMDGKHYNVSWIRDDKMVCSVTFPIDYCLLHNTTLHENEEKLISDLSRLKNHCQDSVKTWVISPFDLIKIADTNIFILQGDSIYISELNNTQYFTIEDTSFKPIFSPNFPRESFSNLVVSNMISNKYLAEIKIVQYGRKHTTIMVPFANLMNYFEKKGCTPYFGVMENNDSTMIGLLLLANIPEGYCHTIRLVIDTNDIDTGEGTIAGRMVAYIPISKIKKLFQ